MEQEAGTAAIIDLFTGELRSTGTVGSCRYYWPIHAWTSFKQKLHGAAAIVDLFTGEIRSRGMAGSCRYHWPVRRWTFSNRNCRRYSITDLFTGELRSTGTVGRWSYYWRIHGWNSFKRNCRELQVLLIYSQVNFVQQELQGAAGITDLFTVELRSKGTAGRCSYYWPVHGWTSFNRNCWELHILLTYSRVNFLQIGIAVTDLFTGELRLNRK